jgi:hypothetical protein
MDIDLSTDLESLPNLVDAARKSGGVAIGSRFHRDSKVSRSLMRKFVSSGYRLVLRTLLGTHIDDAPCGFKAASAEVVDNILPFVRDDRWFFDTELVIRAERGGYDVVQVPVIWSEKTVPGRASKVNVPKLAIDYFRKVIELKKRLK